MSYRCVAIVAYTHLYQGEREQLDHILVSEQFYDHTRNRLWSFKEQRIWNDHLDCARFLWDPAAR